MNLETDQYESASTRAISSDVMSERSMFKSSMVRENFLGRAASAASIGDSSESQESSSSDVEELLSEGIEAGIGVAEWACPGVDEGVASRGDKTVGQDGEALLDDKEDCALVSRISRKNTTRKGVTRSLMPWT